MILELPLETAQAFMKHYECDDVKAVKEASRKISLIKTLAMYKRESLSLVSSYYTTDLVDLAIEDLIKNI